MKRDIVDRVFVFVASLILVIQSARAAEGDAREAPKGILPVPDYSGDLWLRSHLSGDWGGTRTDLANKGIQFDVDWTQYVQSVVAGGVDSGTEYGGHFDYLLHLDLMRMG